MQDWQRQSERRTIQRSSCASPPAFVFLAGSASGRLPYHDTAQKLYHTPIEKTIRFLFAAEMVSSDAASVEDERGKTARGGAGSAPDADQGAQ